jgi:hypothetical protein
MGVIHLTLIRYIRLFLALAFLTAPQKPRLHLEALTQRELLL